MNISHAAPAGSRERAPWSRSAPLRGWGVARSFLRVSTLPDFVQHRECNRAGLTKSSLAYPTISSGRHLTGRFAAKLDGGPSLLFHSKTSVKSLCAEHQQSTGCFHANGKGFRQTGKRA